MKEFSPSLKVKLWLKNETGLSLGLGRAKMLEEIARYGSLNKAAKQMGMSYRAAWGRLKKLEELLGIALVDKSGAHKGFVLTEQGREVARLFLEWHKDVERYALMRAKETFPWPVHLDEEKPEAAEDETPEAGGEHPEEPTAGTKEHA